MASPAKRAALVPGHVPGHGHNYLLAITCIQNAFDYLDGPAPVLNASLACRRWRELATADMVWRAKFERDRMREKMGRFEVDVPVGRPLWMYRDVFSLKGYQLQNQSGGPGGGPITYVEDGIRTAVEAVHFYPAAARAYGPIAVSVLSGRPSLTHRLSHQNSVVSGPSLPTHTPLSIHSRGMCPV